MKKRTILIACITIISFFSCSSDVKATFHISNVDMNQAQVPLMLIIDKDTIFNEKAKYTNRRPDIQYIERIKLPKGNHEIIFEVANTGLKKVENIIFDKDKRIFLSYIIDSNEKPKLIVHVMDNQPQYH